MAANIYVYCPAGTDGLSRCDLEEALEGFFGGAAEDCGAAAVTWGSTSTTNWRPARICSCGLTASSRSWLASAYDKARSSPSYADGWEPGTAWRRVEVFGTDRWLTEPDPK